MQEITQPAADVGVIIGRFQVDDIRGAHEALVSHVMEHHDMTLILLGLSPVRVTMNNPLDFQARKQMLQKRYPAVGIYYVRDRASDTVWSQHVDDLIIEQVKPGASVMLYGGRDAFIAGYKGKYPTTELMQESYISGTAIRKTLSNSTKGSPDFRAGVIWASQNRYPITYPTVDVAVWSDDEASLLLARKAGESLFRFIGGFAEGPTYEADARREVEEEADIAITDPSYVGSHQVDDWRYRREADKIVTLLFEAKKFSGLPKPKDDIEELKWFQFGALRGEQVVPEHRPLLEMLRGKKEANHVG